MNRLKILAAFIALAALGRAESTEVSDRIVQMPPVVVEATRLPNPVIDVHPALDEARSQANLAMHIDMRRTLGRSFRRLANSQRRATPAAGIIPGKPNA